MKKLLSIMMAMVLIALLLAGCGGSSETADTPEAGTDKETLTAAANIDYAPFEFYKDGVAVGFDVDGI